MKKILKEFKEFISRGNVLDLAVGMIIGSAFTAIVSSLVADVFTPILGFLIPNGGFANLNGIGPGFNFGNFINALVPIFSVLLYTAIRRHRFLKPIREMN